MRKNYRSPMPGSSVEKFQFRCDRCGLVFDAVRRDATYCSPKCRQAASRSARAAKPSPAGKGRGK